MRTGLSKSTLYAKIKDGSFPRPVKIGARAVGWIAADIDDWMAQRVSEARLAA